jgi:hypothetical protein
VTVSLISKKNKNSEGNLLIISDGYHPKEDLVNRDPSVCCKAFIGMMFTGFSKMY